MKTLITVLALTFTVGAFAQERVYLNKKSVSVNADRAVLVRNSQTPSKVEVTFQVPMANSVCEDYRTRIVPRTCVRHQNIYGTRRVCRTVSTSSTPSSGPRGPRYNPPSSRQECRNETVVVGTRRIAYDCSYSESYCARYGTNVRTESDKVKIKFKLPKLGGTEEETFIVTAQQRSYDGANVEYDIKPESDLQEVKKKGILGYDSYVIQSK